MMSFLKRLFTQHPLRKRIGRRVRKVGVSSIRPYYLFAMLILVVLAALSFLGLHQFTTAQKTAAQLINITRLQRTLSQRIALLASQVVSENDSDERDALQVELAALIAQMLTAHEGLSSGSIPGQFDYVLSPQLQNFYFGEPLQLDQQVRDYLALAQQLTDITETDLELNNPAFVAMTEQAPGLLTALDTTATQYQVEENERVAQLEGQEVFSFFASLGTLALITLFIFYPMEFRIHQEQRALLTEIDMRREAERMLLQSEALYRLMAANLPDSAVLLYDRDLRYLLAEGPLLEETGLSRFKVEGKTIYEVLPPASVEALAPMYQSALDGQEVDFERVMPNKVYHVRIVPVRDEKARATGGLIVTQDITLRKRAEAQLKESEERFRQIAETIRSVFWMVDPETGKILYISPAYDQIWGRSREEYLNSGLSMAQDIHPEDRERVSNERRTKAKTGQYDVEYRIIRPDGTIRWINSTSYPVVDEHGNVTRIIGTSDDITEQKELQYQAFSDAIKRERVQLLSDFIRDTSHDLRTPLTIMATSVYLLRRNNDPEDQGPRFDLIDQQINRLNQLITDLHTMADLDTTTHIEKWESNINQLVSYLYGEYSKRAQEVNKRMQLDLQPDLPLIQVNERTLNHALINLLNNALEYTDEGGTITLRTELVDQREVVISVEDDGVGIAPEHLPRVFDRLFKVDSARSTRSGPGLGLAMVKRLMELHGGRVEVESTFGEGSVFRLCIPVEVGELLAV
jgi:PAS domain S-box-containing protein